MKEVDALAILEFWEDQHQIGEKSQFQNCVDIFKTYPPTIQDKNSVVRNNPLGQINESPIQKAEPVKVGLGSWIKENPIESIIIGALLAGGIFALYKHYSNDKEIEKKKLYKRKEKKKRKSLKELWEEREDEITPEETEQEVNDKEEELNAGEENESDLETESEISSGKDLGICIMTAIGGNVIGAALGNNSLIASIPIILTGIYKSSFGITLAGTGMALATGYNNGEGKESVYISQALNRISNYLESLFGKFTSIFCQEEKLVLGAVKTMLGYIPESKIYYSQFV